MSIDTYSTPNEINGDLHGHAVIVVDALRATSVIVTAIANGCRSIIPVAEVEDAVAMARRLGNDRLLLGGERRGLALPGFQLANSPQAYKADIVENRSLVFSTSNGTRAILRVGLCAGLFIGSFLNAKNVAETALQASRQVAILCAGTNNRYSLDDILCAGAIIDRLLALEGGAEHTLCDLSRSALVLYRSNRDNLFAALEGSNHFEALRALGFEDDIRFCLREDEVHATPVYQNGTLRKA